MPFDLEIQAPGAAPERFPLPAAASAGGSQADGVRLPGAPPAAARLEPLETGVVIVAASAGVRVGGHAVPPGGRRLLRPGERAEIHGTAVALVGGAGEAAPEATRQAAAAVLRGAAAGRVPARGARLVVLTGPAAGALFAVADGAVLGRGRSAAVRLPDARISRRHARLRVGPAGTTVEDLGSKNGLGVNGVRVDRRPVPLRPGDELVAGETALALEDPAPALPALPAAPASAAGTRGPRAPPPHVAAAALLALSALALVVAAS